MFTDGARCGRGGEGPVEALGLRVREFVLGVTVENVSQRSSRKALPASLAGSCGKPSFEIFKDSATQSQKWLGLCPGLHGAPERHQSWELGSQGYGMKSGAHATIRTGAGLGSWCHSV